MPEWTRLIDELARGMIPGRVDPLFSYTPGNSLLHQIDARAKLIALILCAYAAVASSAGGLIVITGPILLGIARVRISPVILIRRLTGIMLLGIVIVVVSVIQNGVTDGSVRGLLYAARLILLVLAAELFLATTTLRDIRLAAGRLLRFAPRRFGWTLSVMLALTISFVPVPFRIASEIRLASISRGLAPRRHPVRYLKTLVSQLSIRSLFAANDKADAFECRRGPINGRPFSCPVGIDGYLFMASCILISGMAVVL